MDRRTPLRVVACLAIACASPAFAQQDAAQEHQHHQTTAAPVTTEQTVEDTVTVTAVDKAKRTVTLKNKDGEESTINVGPEVKRFDEVAVGDTVRATYTIGITSELRAPTEEEKADPLVAIEGGGVADASAPPAGGAARMFRVVATIEALDRPAQTVTLKGPNGNFMKVKVQDPALLEAPRIGDSVVITAAESVVLSLEKAGKK